MDVQLEEENNTLLFADYHALIAEDGDNIVYTIRKLMEDYK